MVLHDDGDPRLVDFGLAAHLGSPRLREICGTPQFMAPEQARGEWDRIDQRADVFGLGAVLYSLLTGHPPHEGASVSEVLDRARKGDVAPPRRLDPTIPAPVEAVCLKALAAAPENRHATALEFATALRQAIAPPPRLRWRLPAAVLACVVLAAAFWFWPRDSTPSNGVAPPEALGTVASPIQAEISVKHFKEWGDGKKVRPVGTISETSLGGDPPRLNDLVRVRVTLSRPAYGYLIALNPDGKDQLCVPTGAVAGGPPRREFDFPEDPADYFGLTDGVGLQAFVAVMSDQPLPAYASWKATVPGGLAWSPADREGLWTYDSAEPSEAKRLRGHLRGDILKREAAPEGLNSLCDRLRRSPGVTLVRAVAFPVKPDVEIIK